MVFLQTLWLMVPGIFADMTPVFFSKVNFLNYPLDFNKKLNNKPIFGKNKTFRGLILGILVAILIAYLQFYLIRYDFFSKISLLNYENFLLIGFLLGFGALFGDLVKSFFKRQFNIKPGKAWIPFDQIDSFIGAFVFLSFYYIPPLSVIITAFILSLILHFLIPYLGYLLKIRNARL